VRVRGVREQNLVDLLGALVAEKMPPSMSSGVIAQGANRLSNSAAGSRMSSLLRSEPLAIFQTIGSSRSAAKPTT
jgi:hypothetical protein